MKLPNREMSFFILKTASIESLRALGVDVIASTIAQRYVFMTHKDVFRIVTGLAKLDVVANESIMEALALAIKEHSRQFGAHELAGMAVELAASHRRLGNDIASTVIFQITTEFARKIPAASPHDLASVAIACADSGISDPTLFGKMAESAVRQMALFHGSALCDFLLAYACLGLVHPGLMQVGIPALAEFLPSLPSQQLVDVGFIFTRMATMIESELVSRWCQCLEMRADKDLGLLTPSRLAGLAIALETLRVDLTAVPRTARIFRSNNDWRSADSDEERIKSFSAKLGIPM